MATIGIILSIIGLLLKLPEIIEDIKALIERIRNRVPKTRVLPELRKLAKACDAKAESLGKHTVAAGPCPVAAFAKELKAKYP